MTTKVGYALGSNMPREEVSVFAGDLPDVGVSFDYSRSGFLSSLEASLDRLRLAHVDTILVHDLDPTVHRDEADFRRHLDVALADGWPALRELRHAGQVAAIGFGINDANTALVLVKSCDPDLVLLAGRYTLLDHLGALPFFRECDRCGVSVVVGGPFNSGILAEGSHHSAMYDYEPAAEDVMRRIVRLEAICKFWSVPLSAAALQFSFGQSAVISVVPGMRSAGEVESNTRDMAYPTISTRILGRPPRTRLSCCRGADAGVTGAAAQRDPVAVERTGRRQRLRWV